MKDKNLLNFIKLFIVLIVLFLIIVLGIYVFLNNNKGTGSLVYKESLLNGTDPVLGSGMIPVTISGDGTVVYANTSNEWYNYEKKEWANSVILSSGTYKVGDVIPNSSIESYFVWIPKYSYQLFNVDTSTTSDTEFAIKIKFGTVSTNDSLSGECTTVTTSGFNGNCDNLEYMTHPAFTTLNKNGIWVGKYETGYLGATNTKEAEVTSLDSNKIIVKPNVYSWRNNNIYNSFTASYNYNRTLDSHMMKNTEWGAVVYLANSIYGINKSININDNTSYKTGYSTSTSVGDAVYPDSYGDGGKYNQAYNTKIGYLASTTGNISGIYDMSGGASEYMASYVDSKYLLSGFTTENLLSYDSKYFDIYSAASRSTLYDYRILGDATGEMEPFKFYAASNSYERFHSWYEDMADFVDSDNSWFVRGGGINNSVETGQFAFSSSTGYSNQTTFRLVVTY